MVYQTGNQGQQRVQWDFQGSFGVDPISPVSRLALQHFLRSTIDLQVGALTCSHFARPDRWTD
jgi:hypothetical protein